MFSVAVVALCCASAVSAESVVGVPVDGRPSGVPSHGVMSMLPPGKVYDYSFDIIKDDPDQYWCEVDKMEALSTGSDNMRGRMSVFAYKESLPPQIGFTMSGKNSQFIFLCNLADNCEDYMMNLRCSFTLSNGEEFRVSEAVFGDERDSDLHGSETVGYGYVLFNFLDCTSSKKSMSGMTTAQRIGYIAQQLRTYDIKELKIVDFTLKLDAFSTAATLNSMFNTLAKNIGKDMFRYK